MRMIFRWHVAPEHRDNCARCGVELNLGPKDRPRLIVQHVVGAPNRTTVSVSPVCWRCWRRHQDQEQETALV